MKKELYKLVCRIFETGKLPQDFTKSVIVPFDAQACEFYHTLSLVYHSSKIIMGIVLKRIENKIKRLLSEDQFGFRKDVGTGESILILRQIIGKQLRKVKPTFMAYVDLEKAFDIVNWNIIFDSLYGTGVNYREGRIMYNMYHNEKGIIRCGNKEEEEASIKKGVRQDCSLSPYLFNLYIQKGNDSVREKANMGITIQGEKADIIRFADDIGIIAESEEDLQEILSMVDSIMIIA